MVNILVVGDLMLDNYLFGSVERCSPEAPVPIVQVERDNKVLGGAGNVVNNLVALGCKVAIASVVGDDPASKVLGSGLKKNGVTSFVEIEPGRKTTCKTRVIAHNQQVIRFDEESTHDISHKTEKILLERINSNFRQYDLLIISDYGKGLLTSKFTKKLIEIAASHEKKILVDPKGLDYSKYMGAHILTPNQHEAELALDLTISDKKSLKVALTKLKEITSVEIPLITLGEDGIGYQIDTCTKIQKAMAREVYDVTGAGDTVISALAYALTHQMDIDESIHFANIAAGIVTRKLGSSTATLLEIFDYEKEILTTHEKHSVKTLPQMKEIVIGARAASKTIVFTNGCFDILHSGHVKYLEKAKELGDMLIVGINSDASVKRIKGVERPINSEKDRSLLISSLRSVDFVVIFKEDTPFSIISELMPDIIAKGSDYKNMAVVGSELVDKVILIDYVDGYSSTEIINKVKKI